MIEDKTKEWGEFVELTLTFLDHLDMNISPMYLETPVLYSYPISDNVTVWDIPLDNMSDDVAQGVIKIFKEYGKSPFFAPLLKTPSEDDEGDKLSMIVPTELTAVFTIGNASGVLIDTNMDHMGNIFIPGILESVGNTMVHKFKTLWDD